MKNKFRFPVFIVLMVMLALSSCKDSTINDPKTKKTETHPIDSIGDVSVWLTTISESYLLSQSNSIDFSDSIGDFSIVIDTTRTFQRIDGFGAALTGSSAYLIQQMNSADRNKLLKDLFDPASGIGINYLRITIGSSDFSIGTYSYCDNSDISTFAIPQRDKDDLIPVLKQILNINPTIKILASPWSAPAWMKSNNSMLGGSLKGSQVYSDFAEYFCRYVEAFAAEGIKIDAITLQNEPMYETSGYPTMKMDWSVQNTIIRDYLGPQFAVKGIKTKIIIWDHNFDMAYYPINILNDPETRKYVAGTAWHGYGGDASAIDQVQDLHPDKEVYFTEQSGGTWNTDSRMGNMFYYMKYFLMASVNRGSKNFMMWNLALNPNHGPTTTNEGCQNCRGVVTINTNGTYKRNEEYYLLGHFSKFVRLDALRVENSISKQLVGITVSTFVNTDGSKVVVVMNRTGKQQKYNIRCGNRNFIFKQPNESATSLVFK